jgi:hypothetical protein
MCRGERKNRLENVRCMLISPGTDPEPTLRRDDFQRPFQ